MIPAVSVEGWMYRHDAHLYTLIGWQWYRNGSWGSRYLNGSRLLYVLTGPVLFNRQVFRLLVKW
jgi:hypothetical protein